MQGYVWDCGNKLHMRDPTPERVKVWVCCLQGESLSGKAPTGWAPSDRTILDCRFRVARVKINLSFLQPGMVHWMSLSSTTCKSACQRSALERFWFRSLDVYQLSRFLNINGLIKFLLCFGFVRVWA